MILIPGEWIPPFMSGCDLNRQGKGGSNVMQDKFPFIRIIPKLHLDFRSRVHSGPVLSKISLHPDAPE